MGIPPPPIDAKGREKAHRERIDVEMRRIGF
jgi:hypothetical protein